ncbi:MAG TPA: twin-arginine translocase TatA/TatE family subunit [Pirellulales bacterium]|jgi:sec-independent protein translocase protein TatA|nr:twin-arginine translocase TatA/TatE family subunit [Pirellulales bacterium]
MFGLSPIELMVVGVVAVLLFGNKLPSVARSLGKSVTDFKKGMAGIEDEFRSGGNASTSSTRRYNELDDRDEPTAPKFEPPTSEPKATESA